ncbi:hypothetical protein FDP41_009180 [Naegleria fowleri]|uniref:Uncharacterized protein n=1 Tax=Naegleria fowleri TaxID=5763 RepID=A0A6A5B1M5_NAEFO|nr:uncharacterized protein FDP41_009180 [Naegleria fowleri]KAF0972277.1 hypothetical protein FDP41_009180 [Naegleria fowleri]
MERTNLLEKLSNLESQFEEYHLFKKAYEKYNLINQENMKLKHQINELTLEIDKLREDSTNLSNKIETPNACYRHIEPTIVAKNNSEELFITTSNGQVIDYFEEEMRELTSTIQQMNLDMAFKNSKIDALLNENKLLKSCAVNYQANFSSPPLEKSVINSTASTPNFINQTYVNLHDDLKGIIEERQNILHPKLPHPEPILKIHTSTQTPTIHTHSQFTSTKDFISSNDCSIQVTENDMLPRPSPAEICLNSPSPPIPSQLSIISNHLMQANTATLAERFKDFSALGAIHAAKIQKSQKTNSITSKNVGVTPSKTKKTFSASPTVTQMTTKCSSSPIMIQSSSYIDPKSLPYFDNQYRVFIQEHSYKR